MIQSLFVHTATVETYSGVTPTGDGYGDPVTVKGFLDDGIVRQQGSDGEQLVQKSVWYGPITDAAVFVPESRVTVNGRASQVTAVRRREGGSLFAPVAHIEVDLT